MIPLVFIIILNWNGLKDTIECLESLKKITYLNYKVIVVDNGSKNNEGKALKEKFGDYIHLIQNKENLGFAEGNNVGIEYALKNNADYILLLNNDTVVDKNFLNELIKITESDGRIGIVGSKILYFNLPNKIWFAGGKINKWLGESKHTGLNKIDGKKFQNTKKIDRASGCCMLMKGEIFKKIGLLDKNYFTLFEETDFCLRAKKAGYKIAFAPKSIIWHKVSQSTIANSPRYIYYYTRNRLYFMKKHAKIYHWLVFLPYFILESIIFIVYWKLKGLDKNSFRSQMIKKGIYDFFHCKLGKADV